MGGEALASHVKSRLTHEKPLLNCRPRQRYAASPFLSERVFPWWDLARWEGERLPFGSALLGAGRLLAGPPSAVSSPGSLGLSRQGHAQEMRNSDGNALSGASTLSVGGEGRTQTSLRACWRVMPTGSLVHWVGFGFFVQIHKQVVARTDVAFSIQLPDL